MRLIHASTILVLSVVQGAVAAELTPNELESRLLRLAEPPPGAELKRDLFSTAVRTRTAVRKAPAKSVLPRLVGAFASAGRREAFFVLANGASVIAKEGDLVQGYRVLRIDSQGVLVEGDGTGDRFKLRLSGQ